MLDASAAIPEPANVLWGAVTDDGLPKLSGAVSVRRNGEVVAQTELGHAPIGPGSYVLRVELFFLEDGETQPPGSASEGDTLQLFVDEVLVATVPASRGEVTQRDIALSTTDQDGDGVADGGDNCGGVANPSQADADGNGIGDACESLVNPPPAYRLVGEVGNPADPATGFGAVDQSYLIGQTEVTNARYVAFLNAVAASDPGSLYNAEMGSDPRGGILRGGSDGSFSYAVKPNMGDKPVNFVSWLDAARYVNWTENGMPLGAQGPGTTEDGAFDLAVALPELNAPPIDGAAWSLPTEDEWVKAAYYDPTRGGSDYWLYPTRSDIDPIGALASPLGDVANPGAEVANYDTTATWNGAGGNVVTVASAGAPSFFGTDDQGGNVAEWLFAAPETGQRPVRGGSFGDGAGIDGSVVNLQSTTRVLVDPLAETANIGFRIVQVDQIPGDADRDGILADGDGSGTPGDAFCNGSSQACDDNCPDWPNPSQIDVDGNGRGDLCECGDQNGDGTLNVGDILAINLAIFDTGLVTPLCDADNDGGCNIGDILAVNAAIFGASTSCERSPPP